jgi:lysophospholipase L1-like esterase
MAPRFRRYVALGDSSTEGLDDPDGAGGFRGWADRLAEHVARTSPELLYANLAVRGRSAGEIRASQLADAVVMRPDLATVVAGMNDLLRGDWSADRVAGEVATMVRALRAVGATVITFTIPDLTPRVRLAGALSLAERTAGLNHALRRVSAASGARLVDLAALPHATDPRLWADDRLHANPDGHARVAAALAQALGLPDADEAWAAPLPPRPPARRRAALAADVAWLARYVAPWALRRLRGKTLGDGRTAKRPHPTPVDDLRRDSERSR